MKQEKYMEFNMACRFFSDTKLPQKSPFPQTRHPQKDRMLLKWQNMHFETAKQDPLFTHLQCTSQCIYKGGGLHDFTMQFCHLSPQRFTILVGSGRVMEGIRVRESKGGGHGLGRICKISLFPVPPSLPFSLPFPSQVSSCWWVEDWKWRTYDCSIMQCWSNNNPAALK